MSQNERKVPKRVLRFVKDVTLTFTFGQSDFTGKKPTERPVTRILKTALAYSVYAGYCLLGGMSWPMIGVFFLGRLATQMAMERMDRGKLPPKNKTLDFMQSTGFQVFFGQTERAERDFICFGKDRVAKLAGYAAYGGLFVASGSSVGMASLMTGIWFLLERGMSYYRSTEKARQEKIHEMKEAAKELGEKIVHPFSHHEKKSHDVSPKPS